MENAVAGFRNADIVRFKLRTISRNELVVLLEMPAEMLIEIAIYHHSKEKELLDFDEDKEGVAFSPSYHFQILHT